MAKPEPHEFSLREMEKNPLWRWERPWIFGKWLALFGPVAFLFAVYSGFRPFDSHSPHAGYCGNCALGDLMGTVIGVPLGTLASALIGAAVGRTLDHIPNAHRNGGV